MIKVVVHTEGLLGWGGGIDFLKYYLSILNQLENIRTIVAIPYDQYDQKIIRLIKNCVKKIVGYSTCKCYDYGTFWSDYQNIKIQMYRRGSIPTCMQEADVVFLNMSPIKNVKRNKIIGYIPDLQHIHLPYLFTEEERASRNRHFIKMMRECGTIFVNSQHTCKDLKEQYLEESKKCNFFLMDFLPFGSNLYDVLNVNIEKYKLPKRYFMFSNQLWVHKDLPTALRAMRLLLQDERYKDVELICSGVTYDYRNLDYWGQVEQLIQDLEIQNHVRFLGYIPKNEQLAILRSSISVIQTTLFEGGPGGGATYDAVAYGASAIISDIEINQEIENDRVSFFKVGDSEDLCLKMKGHLDHPLKPLPVAIVEKQCELNFQQACFDIDKLITEVAQCNDKCSSV